VVPRQPLVWRSEWIAPTNRRWLAVAALGVLALGGARALAVRDDLQRFASEQAALGREAKGTMIVLDLGPDVIAGPTLITFFGYDQQQPAWRLRMIVRRYGRPAKVDGAIVDRALVDHGIARARLAGQREHPGCQTLAGPLLEPGTMTHALGLPPDGEVLDSSTKAPLQLWADEPFLVDIRRFGDSWVRLAAVPAGRSVVLTLPALNTDRPWEVRADGACDVTPR
jgi:hypothetical protein